MAIPILIMEFVMGKCSGVEVSLLLQMEERIMGKGNNGGFTTSPHSFFFFFSWLCSHGTNMSFASIFLAFTFLNLGHT